MSIADQVGRLGGVARTRELEARGLARRAIAAAERRGEIVRARRGWYALPTLSDEVRSAVGAGGALACISAAREHGLWVPPDHHDLHIAVPPTAARLGVRRGLVVHWTDPASRTVQPVADAVALAARCCGAPTAFVLLESALHLRMLRRGERVLLTASVPRRFRQLSRHASPHSESGTESLLKLVLLSMGLPFQQQVVFAGVGRVDFLLGTNLVVEVDSRAHHSEPYRDRKRDAILSARGIRVLRFTYAQIVYERAEVEAALLGAVIRGDLAG